MFLKSTTNSMYQLMYDFNHMNDIYYTEILYFNYQYVMNLFK